MRNPDPTVFPVCERRCNECLFSTAKIVDDDRKQEVLAEARRNGQPFICHKGTLAGEYLVCRGWFDQADELVVQLARTLGRVVFRPIPQGA